MTVRAKFKVTNIALSLGSKKVGDVYEPCEVQSINLQPVYGNGDPEHENTKFWLASPSGSITLSTVNESAGQYFKLGGEYYVDFTKA